MARKKVIVIGSGNAALCAGIAALDEGADTIILEKASAEEAGGNSRYTAGAMRFAYQSGEDLLPLLGNPQDERLKATEFGSYPVDQLVAAESFSEAHEKLQQQFVLTSTGPEPMFNCPRRMPTIFLTIERYKPESLGLFARR